MRLLGMILILAAGMGVETMAEEQQKRRAIKKSGTKQTYNLPEVGDEVLVGARKPNSTPKKGAKWEGPEYDATKSKTAKKGKK